MDTYLLTFCGPDGAYGVIVLHRLGLATLTAAILRLERCHVDILHTHDDGNTITATQIKDF